MDLLLASKPNKQVLTIFVTKKDTTCHNNSLQRLQTVALIEDYTARLLVRLLSCGRLFAAAVHKCRWLLVQSDVQYSWWGGAGAMLFTQSITLITAGVLWHLCQGGRTSNVARGGVLAVGGSGKVRATTEGKNGNKKIRQRAVEIDHLEQLQMAFRK